MELPTFEVDGIVYQQQTDGSWWNLNMEREFTDEFIRFHFDECRCVLPEQSCPVCRDTAREVYEEG